jgi:hypothetical protein
MDFVYFYGQALPSLLLKFYIFLTTDKDIMEEGRRE